MSGCPRRGAALQLNTLPETSFVRVLASVPSRRVRWSLGGILFPMLRSGFPRGHAAAAHLTYAYLFDVALTEGQFPVRWIEWVKEGHSQPLFNFYQPGLYYVVQAVHTVIPALSVSLKATVILLWWLGAFFTYLTLSRFGRLAAAMGALVYALSPYVVLLF